jgi:hypothetical protein
MSPELEKQLVSLVEAAKQAGSDTFAFVQAQAPEVVQELLRWKAASAICGMTLGLTMAVALSLAVKKGIKMHAKEEYGAGLPLVIFSGMGAFAGVVMFCINTYGLVYVLCAPRLVVLEALGSLVK